MKIDDIIKLKEQGYSSEEIVSLSAIITEDKEPIVEKQEGPSVDDITKIINDSVKNAVHDYFVTNAQNTAPKNEIENKGLEALASIIRPSKGVN